VVAEQHVAGTQSDIRWQVSGTVGFGAGVVEAHCTPHWPLKQAHWPPPQSSEPTRQMAGQFAAVQSGALAAAEHDVALQHEEGLQSAAVVHGCGSGLTWAIFTRQSPSTQKQRPWPQSIVPASQLLVHDVEAQGGASKLATHVVGWQH
jgi:hypothetical protein